MKKKCFVVLLVLLFMLPLFSSSSIWELIDNSGPDPRSAHTMVYDDSRDVLVLFGGSTGNGVLKNDTWEYDGNSWRLVSTSGPSPRYYHAMVYDSDRQVVVLFGGCLNPNPFIRNNETWEYDGNGWSLVSTSGPSPRMNYGLAYDSFNKKVVLFGGYTNYGNSRETWTWDGSSWTLVSTSGPSARRGHFMVYDSANKKVILFGGSTGATYSGYLNDTWGWDGSTWQQLSSTGPTARILFEMACNKSSKKVVMFGGILKNIGKSDDTWEWDGQAWTLVPIAGPSARAYHSMAYNNVTNSVMLFGGSSIGVLSNETWEYSGIPSCDETIIARDQDNEEYHCNSIQEAVDIAQEGWNIEVGSGVHDEQIVISDKSNLTIKTNCGATVRGFEIKRSSSITIDGFDIEPSAEKINGINLLGRSNQNNSVTISNCKIHNAKDSYNGIRIGRNNAGIYIINNDIRENGRNGILFDDVIGGLNFVTGNTIEENGWNGIKIGYSHEVKIENNTINNNGTKESSLGGAYGILAVEVSGPDDYPERINLIGNEIINNKGKEKVTSSRDLGNYNEILDETDENNTTTSGDEGPGVN